jgi:anaerobic selenocysteine-containing dehydrogenase
VLATADGRGGAAIAGDPEHPANFGRLCSKGAALGETLGLATRLLHPMLRQHDGTLARVDWDQALTRVADGFRYIIERHGPDAVAFYLSGQLLTEDYYVANKLMKGFLGSANVDTNSRLCMASSVAGHRRAFGADTVPGLYEDLDQADLIVLVGSNAAWCHPVLFRRMQGQPARARCQAGRHRPRAAPPPPTRPTCISHRARHGHGAVLRPAGAARRSRRVRPRLCVEPHHWLRDRAAGAPRRSRRISAG